MGKRTCQQLNYFQEKLGKALKWQKDCWKSALFGEFFLDDFCLSLYWSYLTTL